MYVQCIYIYIHTYMISFLCVCECVCVCVCIHILPADRSRTSRRLISFQAFLHNAFASAFVAPVHLYQNSKLSVAKYQ